MSQRVGKRDSAAESTSPAMVKIDDLRHDGYTGTCLRPLGLCELGGSCDACWYSPDHPRFRRSREAGKSPSPE